MKEFLRSDKVAGLITAVFGLAMVVFGAFGLVIVAFQRLMPTMPPSRSDGFEHFDEMLKAVQEAFITYLPIMIGGGLVFGVAGFYIYRGSTVARRIAQTNAVLGFIWIIAYSITSYRVMQSMVDIPFYQGPESQWAVILVNVILLFIFPVALIYILRYPKTAVESQP